MRIKGRTIRINQLFYLSLFYGFARYLPSGKIGRKIRYSICRHIFAECGKNVNVERLAFFASGTRLKIGDNSGLGINCYVPADLEIGANVMMGPNCYILGANHEFKQIDIPMIRQGFAPPKKTVIKDDVWIGRDVLMTPGRLVSKGSIIAARTVLCKDFPEYSIIGGNPSKLIRSRNDNQDVLS